MYGALGFDVNSSYGNVKKRGSSHLKILDNVSVITAWKQVSRKSRELDSPGGKHKPLYKQSKVSGMLHPNITASQFLFSL